jgi:regulatory protein
MKIRKKDGTFKEIIYDATKLYRYGLNRLSEREFSRKELQERMTRLQPDQTIIEEVLQKLENAGYLSDERRAAAIIRQFQTRESHRKIKQRLQQKGIQSAMAQDMTSSMGTVEDESEKALALLNRKFTMYDQSKREKMVRFLSSKGFSFDVISKCLRHFSISLDEEYSE